MVKLQLQASVEDRHHPSVAQRADGQTFGDLVEDKADDHQTEKDDGTACTAVPSS